MLACLQWMLDQYDAEGSEYSGCCIYHQDRPGWAQPTGADHNDIDRYQSIFKLWWQFTYNENAAAGKRLKRILDREPWETQYAFTEDFDL